MTQHLPDTPGLDLCAGGKFQGQPVVAERVVVSGRAFEILRLEDAAALLDLPDFARRFEEEDVAPYGVELWPAAILLAEEVLGGEEGGGRSALELGCGLGLVSIAAALRGWRVTASDHEASALAFARHNATRNGVLIHEFQPLDWKKPPGAQRFERVLGADILYQLVDHEPILRCIDALLAPGGKALICDPGRGVADRFPELAQRAGFTFEVRQLTGRVVGERVVNGRVFTLTRQGEAS